MSDAFKHAQERRCESWLTDQDLCDAVAVVGPEGRRVPFLRAPLASLSQPLRAALYGEFQEGQTCELTLKDVTVDAFDVMIRTAYNLEPRLTPLRALRAFVAARLYILDDLAAYCLQYLKSSEDVDGPAALQILNESLQLSMISPEDMSDIHHRCWTTVLTESIKVVQSPCFLETHGSIIAILIELDELYIYEETLWERLVEWSAAAVQKPDLLGPFGAAADGVDGVDQQAILRSISPHIRFTQMSKEFFIDRVRKHLSREESEAVTDYFLLGRQAEGLLVNQRVGLGPMIEPMTCCWFDLPETARPTPIQGGGGLVRSTRTVTFEKPAWVTKVELIWGTWPNMVVPIVSVPGTSMTFIRVGRTWECDPGKTKTVVDIYMEGPCTELNISLCEVYRPETIRIHDFIEVRRAQMESASKLAKLLSAKLCLTPSSVATETADQWRRYQ